MGKAPEIRLRVDERETVRNWIDLFDVAVSVCLLLQTKLTVDHLPIGKVLILRVRRFPHPPFSGNLETWIQPTSTSHQNRKIYSATGKIDMVHR